MGHVFRRQREFSCNSLTPTNGLGTSGSPAIPTESGTNNAFLIQLNSSLKTAGLITYVQSAAGSDYKAKGIQVDSSGNIYVSGEVTNTTAGITFPTSASFSNTGTYTAGKDFTGCNKSANNTGAFPAQIVPPVSPATNSVIGFSDLTCGSGIGPCQCGGSGHKPLPDRRLYILGL